mgnify:FL=1
MDKKIIMLLLLSGVMTFAMACSKSDGTKDNRTQSTSVEDSNDEGVQESSETTEETTMYDNADDNTDISEDYLSGIIPDELEYIPQGYENPAEQQGRLEKLTYDTWESFTYKQKTQKLTKEAWVYIPYGYSEDEKYNVFYLSHGGWSNEYTYNGLRFFWSGESDSYDVTQGTQEYRDFVLDNVLHSETEGDIHYNVYIPDDYDGSEPYALFMTLPGYQGLYFQGVGENVRTEEFGFFAQEYNPKMIIVAPQLNDWQDTSARQTIALTEYFLDTYNIDRDRVYAEGYSGGGETMSRVIGMRPELFTAYLQCSSQWDGGYDAVVKSRTPVYFAIGENDEYYGSEPSVRAYNAIHKLYEDEGLSDSEIDELLVLDVKPTSYFTDNGISNQHGYGGYLFVRDENTMGWLFGKVKQNN